MIPDLLTPLHHDDNVLFWSHVFSYASHSRQKKGDGIYSFLFTIEGHGVAMLHDMRVLHFLFLFLFSPSLIDKSLISRFGQSTVLGSLSFGRGICAYDA